MWEEYDGYEGAEVGGFEAQVYPASGTVMRARRQLSPGVASFGRVKYGLRRTPVFRNRRPAFPTWLVSDRVHHSVSDDELEGVLNFEIRGHI